MAATRTLVLCNDFAEHEAEQAAEWANTLLGGYVEWVGVRYLVLDLRGFQVLRPTEDPYLVAYALVEVESQDGADQQPTMLTMG